MAATIGMFIVLLMGATVTNTGSGEGCGTSWPLCHGEFIPEYAFETMVEYSHRLVTGVEGLIILGLSVTAFPLRRRYPELKALIPLMLFTLVLQSGMGAWAVKYPQTPPVMASHFGISLVCFASVFLVMRVLWETTPIARTATRAVPSGYRALAWVTLLWAVVVAYIGAYMRHSGAELACHTWPLCNGSLIPDLSSPGVAVAWGHRLAAVIALALVAWRELWSRRFKTERPDLYRTDLWASLFVIAQAASGAFVIFSRLSLASTLSHAALMALLFAALADGARRTLPQWRTSDVPLPFGAATVPARAR
ncbi:MAG: COX15/CtaA family protein [Chloroflexi bacterium]|nr:COX15/CtaA family protein [Chloroflexota bacterium]